MKPAADSMKTTGAVIVLIAGIVVQFDQQFSAQAIVIGGGSAAIAGLWLVNEIHGGGVGA